MEKKTYKGYSFEVGIDEIDGESPRGWGNLGYFITADRNYQSPDQDDTLENIVKEAGSQASSCDEHIKMIREELKDWDEKILEIYPISKYEHGGISYSLGESHGWDSGVVGFYIITDKTAKEIGVNTKDFEKVINQELRYYNQWVNGEVYNFYCEEINESCCGFYDLEQCEEEIKALIDSDIRDNGRKKRAIQEQKDQIARFITSDNEKIARHAKGIAKELDKLSL